MYNVQTFLYFCKRNIKSSRSQERTHQPSLYDNLATVVKSRCGSKHFSLQKQTVMQQHIYYIKFALQFADYHVDELVDSFNREVNNNGWVGMRAYHDLALIDEFQRRGIDASSVYDGKAISFAHPVRYDVQGNRLVTVI